MKLPKRLADILKRKQEFIDLQRDQMENMVIRQQSELFNNIVSDIIPQLDIKDGQIVENAKNYRLISQLDKTYRNFQLVSGQATLDKITPAISKIGKLTTGYFEIALASDLPVRFDKVIESVTKLTNLRLGLDGGKLIRGGYLQSFFDLNTVGTELKQMTSKAVTSNMDLTEFVKLLKGKITGTKEYIGGLERQFQRFGYDIYQQYDRSYNLSMGNEFGFTYFIYQGGLIKDSRDFCAAHNNKVWSLEEAQEWSKWTPSKGQYPEGYEIKAKDLYSVPGYMNYEGYDPMIDMGGYNCRHSPGWLPDGIAKEMRPDLKK